MSHEIEATQGDDIEELRKILPGRASIKKHGDGHEIVIPSSLDDALTFFVTFPRSKLDRPQARATPTEPLDGN